MAYCDVPDTKRLEEETSLLKEKIEDLKDLLTEYELWRIVYVDMIEKADEEKVEMLRHVFKALNRRYKRLVLGEK